MDAPSTPSIIVDAFSRASRGPTTVAAPPAAGLARAFAGLCSVICGLAGCMPDSVCAAEAFWEPCPWDGSAKARRCSSSYTVSVSRPRSYKSLSRCSSLRRRAQPASVASARESTAPPSRDSDVSQWRLPGAARLVSENTWNSTVSLSSSGSSLGFARRSKVNSKNLSKGSPTRTMRPYLLRRSSM